MPRMGGPDVLKAVRSNEALVRTAVVFLTARAGAERNESLESGADGYLTNPFEDNKAVGAYR
jgi:CheY-like chemotaxis protein